MKKYANLIECFGTYLKREGEGYYLRLTDGREIGPYATFENAQEDALRIKAGKPTSAISLAVLRQQ
jgi:hypothetical protein